MDIDNNNNTFKRPKPKLLPPLQQLQHYNSLNNQLARLQQNMINLEENIEHTAEQLKNIQNFGLAHGAIFMAANRIMRDDFS